MANAWAASRTACGWRSRRRLRTELALRVGGDRRGNAGGLGELWRGTAGRYLERRQAAAAADPRIARIVDSVRHLAKHIHEVPVHVVPCVEGRTEGAPVVTQASRWASIIPTAWSFMLATRARGLGTVWATSTCPTSARPPRCSASPSTG